MTAKDIEQYQFTSDQSRTKAAQNGRKGGIASGKAKRKKASLRRCAQRIIEADIPPSVKKSISKLTGDIEDENDTLYTAAVAVLFKEALNGNVSAFREIKGLVDDIDSYVNVEEEDELSKTLREIAEERNAD